LALSQMGVAPLQLALVVHWTQVLVVVLQTGVLPLHWVLLVHWTQAPLFTHTARLGSARAAHGLVAVQPVQVLLAEQMGVVPEHCACATHWTHLLLVVSQTGVVPEQSLLAVHWTQVPTLEHAARLGSPRPAHWLETVHAAQVLLVLLQMGLLLDVQ
jgi:hypothetical protein